MLAGQLPVALLETPWGLAVAGAMGETRFYALCKVDYRK